nr:hypothetical protein OG499_33410 [Streptomyces anulatus]
MDGTAPTPEPADIESPPADFTSSTPQDSSPPVDPAVALGERILTELGDAGTNNTLVRWLCHHTAALITTADRAREDGDPDANVRALEARTAILQLWQARTNWPQGWPPPRAAKLARVLAAVPDPDDDSWYQPTLPGKLHDIHHRVLAALVDLATSDDNGDLEEGWLNAFGNELTSDETVLLRQAATQPRRSDALLDWWRLQTAEDTSSKPSNQADDYISPHPLLHLAGMYRNTIIEIFAKVAGTSTTYEDDDSDQGVKE